MSSREEFTQAMRSRDEVRAIALLDADPSLAKETSLLLALYARLPGLTERMIELGSDVGIHEAAVLDDVARLSSLVEAEPSRVAAYSADGWTPLHLAAHFDSRNAVTYLIGVGGDVHAESTNPLRNTPLHAAAAGQAAASAAILLSAGARTDARDASGNSPLHVAAAGGSMSTARFLLMHKADRGARNGEGRTAAEYARERGHEEVAALLLEEKG